MRKPGKYVIEAETKRRPGLWLLARRYLHGCLDTFQYVEDRDTYFDHLSTAREVRMGWVRLRARTIEEAKDPKAAAKKRREEAKSAKDKKARGPTSVAARAREARGVELQGHAT